MEAMVRRASNLHTANALTTALKQNVTQAPMHMLQSASQDRIQNTQ
jgi:hypothetical protein